MYEGPAGKMVEVLGLEMEAGAEGLKPDGPEPRVKGRSRTAAILTLAQGQPVCMLANEGGG